MQSSGESGKLLFIIYYSFIVAHLLMLVLLTMGEKCRHPGESPVRSSPTCGGGYGRPRERTEPKYVRVLRFRILEFRVLGLLGLLGINSLSGSLARGGEGRGMKR